MESAESNWLIMQPASKAIDADRLAITPRDVASGLGYGTDPGSGSDPRRATPSYLHDTINASIAEARDLIEPRFVWLIRPASINRKTHTLQLAESHSPPLNVGAIIRSQLDAIEAAAIFVCSIGQALERVARERLTGDDPLSGYVLDAVGSVAVDALGDVLETDLVKFIRPHGWRITNRFSPGYCTWPTADQRIIFAALPDAPAGVTLSESALMSPIKSISGVIGLGANVEHRPYPCDTCRKADCIHRSIKFAKRGS